jgi:hypothetical protein
MNFCMLTVEGIETRLTRFKGGPIVRRSIIHSGIMTHVLQRSMNCPNVIMRTRHSHHSAARSIEVRDLLVAYELPKLSDSKP